MENIKDFIFLIDHICFPYKQFKYNDKIKNNEQSILNLVSDIVVDYVANFIHLDEKIEMLNEVNRMMKEWQNVQKVENFEGKNISSLIRNLEDGQMMPFYLKEQNSCIMFKKIKEDKTIFSAFQVSASNSTVMGSQSDLIGVFPKFSLFVSNLDVLNSISFANQIADLGTTPSSFAYSNKTEMSKIENRDVPEPKLVFEWLPTTLVKSDSSEIIVDDDQKIVKKIRDDIICDKDNDCPFRRSGMWMAIKVVLQLRLCELCGEIKGKIFYKMIISMVVCELCRISQDFQISSDLKLQIIKKLARKLFKLDLLAKESNNVEMINKTVDCCSQVIEKVKLSLEKKFEETILKSRNLPAKLDLRNIDFEDKVHKRIDILEEEIKALTGINCNEIKTEPKNPNSKNRNRTSSFPNLGYLEDAESEEEKITALYDIECWVQQVNLVLFSQNEKISSSQLKELILRYIGKATKFYESDELGNSRMIITCIKIVCLIDKLATEQFPLLNDHQIGINVEPIEFVLMTRSTELNDCETLKNYIKLRNNKAKFDSLVDFKKINENTFSVRYTSKNEKMQLIKSNILRVANNKKNSKLIEVSKEKEIYYDLIKYGQTLSCDTKQDNIKHSNNECIKCCTRIKAEEMTVDIYEWPLPECDHLSNAVIFEILIPETICHLRDSLHILRTKVYGYENNSKIRLNGKWKDYIEITKFINPIDVDLVLSSREITLGSSTKLANKTHYSKLHPKFPDSHFIVPNGYLVQYCDNENVFSYNDEPTYKNLCFFKTEEPYEKLQWTLMYENKIIENRVLADSKSKCSNKLSLREFIKYGSFRAGHRLQLKNLLDAIETRGLHFNDKSVFSLIAQSIWQNGPLNQIDELSSSEKFKKFYPSSHIDMCIPEFIMELHRMLSEFLEINKKCWNDHIILLNILIIASRALSLSPDQNCENNMAKLILECRNVLQNWIKDIDKESTSRDEIPKKEELKKKAFEVSCFIILTFYCDKTDQHLILCSKTHAISWLTAMNFIHKNKLFSENGDTFTRNLFRRVQICLLEIEIHLIDFIRNEPLTLTDFLHSYLTDYGDYNFEAWRNYEKPNHQWFFKLFKSNRNNKSIGIQLCLNGLLLIQNKPIGSLPEDVYRHDNYKEYFGAVDFEVMPSFDDVYQTTKYNDVNYSFFLSGDRLVIKENTKLTQYLFLPEKSFKNLFPSKLVSKYSHWLNLDPKCNVIEFRNKIFSKDNQKVFFKFDLKMKCLESDEGFLIDNQSKTFKEIQEKITFRLESPELVHVFCKDRTIFIKLPRFKLSFEIDWIRNCVLSRDFIGMKVSESQKINTLFGLEKGLVLSQDIDLDLEESKIKKQIIIPNGKLVLKKEVENEHHLVDIDLETINKSSKFYIYDIDRFLNKLQAQDLINSWLYLAWLHASTSHVLTDPFLGATGTEMALLILQSGNCWSTEKLDSEAKELLNSIAQLSPKRQFYPKYKKVKILQNSKWPKIVPSIAANELFQHIADKIIKDSERFDMFSNKKTNMEELFETNYILSCRAYHRYKHLYSNSALLMSFYKTLMNPEFLPKIAFDTKNEWIHESIKNSRLVMSGNQPISPTFNLNNFFFKLNEDLKAHETIDLKRLNLKFFYVVSSWNQINFLDEGRKLRNIWLGLYLILKREEKSPERILIQKLFLSFLAYSFEGEDLEPLLALQQVSNFQSNFQNIEPPNIDEYSTGTGFLFDKTRIENLLTHYFLSLNEFKKNYVKTAETLRYSYQVIHDMTKKQKSTEYVQVIEEFWKKYGANKKFDLNLDYINSHYNHCFPTVINELFQSWAKNIELSKFLSQVEYIVSNLRVITGQKSLKLEDFSTNSNFEKISLKNKVDYIFDFSQEIEYKKEFSKIFTTGFLDPNNQYKLILKTYSQALKRNQQEFPKLQEPRSHPYLEEECNVRKYLINDLKESWNHHLKSTIIEISYNDNNVKEWLSFCYQFLEFYSKGSKKIWRSILDSINNRNEILRLLIKAELSPRFIPFNFLSWLIGNIEKNVKFNQHFLELFGSIAVLWSLEQWSLRCINIIKKGESSKSFLLKEFFENRPHENWSPRDNTEWLVFEIEQNIMIRKIQINVAEAMIHPPDNSNTVIQLNMGEGKTSVIIPLLISSLADGKTLVRVIVLKSLFNMNYNSLKFKLGNVLNKRVYIFPCQRDKKFDQEYLSLYKSVYDECIKYKGVVITLPEFILSFKLKGIDSGITENTEIASKFLETQCWLDNVKRDILDESDELLNSKYQLIYPCGNSLLLDNLRWLVAQAVLSIVRSYLIDLKNLYGENYENENDNVSQMFPQLKLMDDKTFAGLRNRICLDILKGKASEINFLHLTNNQIAHVKRYVLEAEVDTESRRITEIIFETNSPGRNVLLILRNYLVYDVLKFVFTKQWKVEYGVKLKINSDLLQAVPYRAKDVPAERAQFSHPDITILLTQLSYYYSGLTDKQLDQVFDNLAKYSDASAEYQEWICSLPENCNETISKFYLKDFNGINLNDSTQKIELYKLLKYHTQVVNFWLCKFVFPKELRQFKEKFVSSAWDLCSKTHNLTNNTAVSCTRGIVTGFSGTNESTLLLPLTVNNNDLTELKGTNGMLLSCLLQKENDHYTHFEKDLKNKEMLLIISKTSDRIRLILDIGALMLELSNEQVALECLNLNPNIKASVFFDTDDKLIVIDRNKNKCCLETSKYKNNLSDCFIYLDQFHTRGTDLKFPSGIIGAVTLGRSVTKTHLMQGCMRLRMLGQGHSVYFFASDEVNQKIVNRKESENIHTIDIISWAIENSTNEIKNGFSNWAVHGLSSYRRESIFQDYLIDLNIKNYSTNTREYDVVDLVKLYDGNRIDTDLNLIIKKIDDAIQKKLTNSSALDFFKNNSRNIIDKLNQYVRNVKTFSGCLEEEQELEMEIEKQEEKVVERPPCAEPLENKLELDVFNFVKSGIFNKNSNSFIALPNSLDKCSLKELLQHNAWSNQVFTTRDFSKTIKENIDIDSYLRPPRWLCYNQHLNVILIMSDYETNELLPFLKSSQYNTFALILPRIRQNQKRIISFSNIQIPSKILEQIFIYAGSLYFNNKEEETNFLTFISYYPSPRNQMCSALVNKNGYVELKNRKNVFQNIKEEVNLSRFDKDPNDLLIKLYELRNYGVIPKSSHHLKILLRGKKTYE